MNYKELKKIFREHEAANPDHHLTGYITFKEESFDKPYTEEQRTYCVSSDNKAFQPDKCGYSIYGACMDGSEIVRIDLTMAEEHGSKDGWKVEDCAIEVAILSRTCDREIDEPRFFLSKRKATETMLLEVIRAGELVETQGEPCAVANTEKKARISEMISTLVNSSDSEATEDGDRIGYALDSAWVNDASNSLNWDWKINTLKIRAPFDPCYQIAR